MHLAHGCSLHRIQATETQAGRGVWWLLASSLVLDFGCVANLRLARPGSHTLHVQGPGGPCLRSLSPSASGPGPRIAASPARAPSAALADWQRVTVTVTPAGDSARRLGPARHWQGGGPPGCQTNLKTQP